MTSVSKDTGPDTSDTVAPASEDSAVGVMVIDGNSLAYRAFHALPDTMTDPEGNPTGAIFGFSSMLLSLLAHNPSHVVVCWDTPGPTFRHRIDPDYKAGRSAPPDTLPPQLHRLRQVVDALGILQCEDDSYEADDLVATFCRQGTEAGLDVVVVSGDRDCFQLASPQVTVWWTRRGVSDLVEVTPEWVTERFGVSPEKYRELAALRGDSSDNLPGVKGVGEKTAAKLLASYGSIGGVYENLEELTPKLSENLAAAKERVALNLGLTVLEEDVSSAPALSESAWALPALDRIRDLFSGWGFSSLWPRAQALADPQSSSDAARPAA